MEQILHLSSYGARLRLKDGLLEVTVPDISGAGNHTVRTFAAQQVSSILLHRHTSVSADALLLAHRHNVDVFILGDFDIPEAFVAPLTAPPSVQLWQQQLSITGTPQALHFAKHWLCLKIERKIEWLAKIKNYRTGDAVRLIGQCLDTLRASYTRLRHLDVLKTPEAANQLLGVEGAAHRQYLDTLSQLVPEPHRFEGRSRRPAKDLFNSALNYGYAILYRWVEKALWESSLNPYIGCLHSAERRQKCLVFDLVEAFRPWVDKVIFTLFSRKEIGRQHAAEHNGAPWLTGEGKKLVKEAVMERFEQTEYVFHGRRWTLRQAIRLEARRFAALLRQFFSTGRLPAWDAADRQCTDPEAGTVCAVCADDLQS